MRHFRTSHAVAALLALALVSGCSSMRTKKTVVSEPPLIGDAGATLGGTAIAQAPEARVTTVADRHPLLSRPKEYYDSTNGNKLTRTAAAAVIGVPSGIGAEIKQILVGQNPVR
jgi:hypothetical protein